MSVREFLYAIDGFAMSRGAKRKPTARDVMSRERFEELDKLYPDRPRKPRPPNPARQPNRHDPKPRMGRPQAPI